MKFVKRPVAVFAMSFFVLFCVCACVDALRSPLTVAVFGAAFLASLAFSFVKRPSGRTAARYICIAASGALIASSYATLYFSSLTNRYTYLEGTECELTGTVGDVIWETSYENCYLLDADSAGGREVSVGVALTTERKLSVGDVVRTEAQIFGIENRGSFDSVKYYMSRGILLTAEGDEVVKTGESHSLKIAPARLREKLSGILRDSLSEEASSVAEAVLLGNRRHLSDGTKYAFSKVGISHLVAISGMHVSFVCGALFFILKRFGVGRRFASALAIPAVVFYMFLTGLSPSVVRASVIACAMMAMMLLLRTYDGVTALALCGAGMVTVDPTVALSVSMQLSFCAYIGCVAGASLIKRSKRLNPGKDDPIVKRAVCAVLRPIVFTCVIVLTSLPVMLLYFDSVSLLSPLSNLLFIPAFSVVLYLSALVLILSPVPYVSAALSFVADKFIGAVIWAVRKAASIRGTLLSLRYPHAALFAVLICVFVFAFVLGKKKVRRAGAICLAASVALFSAGVAIYEANRPSLTVIRAGGGGREAICVVSGGESLICDVSAKSVSAYSDGASALSKVCVAEPGYYLMTRCDGTGRKLLYDVLEISDLKAVFISAGGADRKDLSKVRKILDGRGVKYYEVGAYPECIVMGDAEIIIRASASGGYPSLGITSGEYRVKYYPYGYLVTDPAGVDGADADCVIVGSVGMSRKGNIRGNFGKCKIYSFTGEDGLPGVDGVERKDEYSTVVLNYD